MHATKKRANGNREEKESSGEEINTELFLLSALKVGLTVADLNLFEIGGVLDLIAEFVDLSDPNRAKRAAQSDFDNFARGGF